MDNGDTAAEDDAGTAAAAGPRKRQPTAQRRKPTPKPTTRPAKAAATSAVAVADRPIDPLMAGNTVETAAPVKRTNPRKPRPKLFEDLPEAPIVYTSVVDQLVDSELVDRSVVDRSVVDRSVVDEVPYVLPTIIHGEPDPEPDESIVAQDPIVAEVAKPSLPKTSPSWPALLARAKEVVEKVQHRLQPAGVPRQHPRVRRVTRVVRHVDTWSVFKVALVFNVFFYCVSLTSAVMLWRVALNTGTIENIERFFESFGWQTFQLKGGEIYHAAWVAGLFIVVGLTGMAVLAATLFNLITDLVGGIRVTVLEEEVVAFDEPSPRWRRIPRPRPPLADEQQRD